MCKICSRSLIQASTGRVRVTCSDRCRQIMRRRYDYPGWKDKRRREQTLRKAEKQIRKWEKQFGLDFSTMPAYHFEPSRMSMRDRLMIYLPREWSVGECWTCKHPYFQDGRTTETCSPKCRTERRQYFKALRANFYHNPRPMPQEFYPLIRARKRLGLCAHCGDPFMPKGKRKYCSERCKDAAYWKRRPLKRCKGCGEMYRGLKKSCSLKCNLRLERREATTCVRCHHVIKAGREVQPNADTRIPTGLKRAVVFCSETCRDRVGWSPLQKVCVECGEGYSPKQKNVQERQQFCTKRCYLRRRDRIRYQAEKAAKVRKVCRHCGDRLPNERDQKWYRYCSDGCRDEAARVRAMKPLAIPIAWIRQERIEVM